MSIVIVGGHDRMHCRYKEICGKYGCKCKVFTQFPANFKNQIGSPDMVIVFTGTVAPKMVGDFKRVFCRFVRKIVKETGKLTLSGFFIYS